MTAADSLGTLEEVTSRTCMIALLIVVVAVLVMFFFPASSGPFSSVNGPATAFPVQCGEPARYGKK